MSGSGRGWRASELILLLAVIVFAVMAVFRIATREPAAPLRPRQETTRPPSPANGARPGPVAGPPPGPACTELLARIRSCSDKDLAGIIDKLSGIEAYGLYRQLTVSERQQVLSAVPSPILARKAQALLGIPESSFRHAGDPGLLASSLVDAAMGASGAADPQRKQLCFTTTVEQDVPVHLGRTFRPEDRTIYACLDAGSESTGESGVLARWTVEGAGTAFWLHFHPIAANRRWNYVSFTATDAWDPGTYRVGFYRIGESASLLAEGTFVIAKGD